MSVEAVVQDHGAVRTIGLATSEAVTGDLEEVCSAGSVGDDGMSSGDCRNDVSGDVYEDMCAWLFVVRSYSYLYYCPRALGSASGHATEACCANPYRLISDNAPTACDATKACGGSRPVPQVDGTSCALRRTPVRQDCTSVLTDGHDSMLGSLCLRVMCAVSRSP
jgi:hypothetical protein